MATNPYAVVRFKLRAEIGEHVFEDVVQFSGTFEINSIPQASLVVAVGKRVDNDKAATIHTAIKQLKVQMPAKVYLEAQVTEKEQATAGVEWFAVDGGQLLFEGFAVGTGWQRTNESASFTIHLLHWLSTLHYASAISASSHPGNPGDWKYPAAFKAIGLSSAEAAGGLSPSEPTWVQMIHQGDVTQGEITEDLWGNVLHKWMRHVATDDPFEFRLQGGQTNTSERVSATLAAIDRIGPNPVGKPLAIDLNGADGDVLAQGLRLALLNESGSSWLNTTLWGKLVGEWSPAYWFAVAPRITDALIVPITGGLQGEPWAVIEADDYSQCQTSGQLHQVLRAVGIVHPITWSTGADGLAGGVVGDRTGCGGWFQPEGLTQGLVMLKDAPKWLSDPNLLHLYSLGSTGAGDNVPIQTSLDPADTAAAPTTARDPAVTQQQNKRILDRYAHQWYVIEMLKGRLGELSGKLRFDIAPGSNVLIKAGVARNLSRDEDALTEDMYATVNRVSFVINAESPTAGTAFSLAHIRNVRENQEPSTSVAKPPLYAEKWVGATLVPGVTVEQEGV